MTRRASAQRALVSAALMLPLLWGCAVPSAAASTPSAAAGDLAALVVRNEDTGAVYRRADWGSWTSRGGCNTRERVLRRDATPGSVRLGPHCRVLTGRWVSPYDGATLTDPTQMQIDHQVSLKQAQQSGARVWTAAQRVAFANDERNLVATSATSNIRKGDRDVAHWRPTQRKAWCDYATAIVHVKRAYRLSVDPAEKAALTSMLNTCGRTS